MQKSPCRKTEKNIFQVIAVLLHLLPQHCIVFRHYIEGFYLGVLIVGSGQWITNPPTPNSQPTQTQPKNKKTECEKCVNQQQKKRN